MIVRYVVELPFWYRIVSLKKSRRLKFSTLADFIFEHTVENLVKRFFNLRPWIVDISLILYSTVGGEVYVNSDVFQWQ